MKNKQTKQIFYYMLLLGVIIAPCFMYVPPIYGCTVDSITLYTGSSSTSLTASALRIPQGSNAYYYARCTVTNPNQYRIRWEFDIDGNGGYEYSTITYYDPSGYYLKAPSSPASRYFSNSGTFNARVRCCLIDASGSAVSSYVSDTCDIYVVGVGSVSAGGETSTPGNIKTIYVAKGSPEATIPVTAAPNPSGAWPSGKPTWNVSNPTAVPIDTAGTTTVTATCGTSSLSINIVVVEVDLDMEGVDDAIEETVGGFIALNDDDDDFDGVMDIDDGYNKDGIPGNDDDVNMSENDLVKITLNKVLPESLTGSLTLSAGNGIKIWQSAIKGGTALTLPVQFNTPADLPKELWIEGVMASTGIRDSFVKLEYEIGDRTFMDNIKITVIDVDIDIWNGLSGPLVADIDEEEVGAYLLVNWDDDNDNGVPDMHETGTVNYENDLSKISISHGGLNIGILELLITGNIGIWQDQDKVTEQINLSWNLASENPPSTLWVEGRSASISERDVQLELKYTIEGNTFSDKVKATVVMINLGNAVYREMDLFGIGGSDVGHSAIIYMYLGECNPTDLNDASKYLIIEMDGPTDNKTLATMLEVPYMVPMGCGSVSGISYKKRLDIIETAKQLVLQAGNIAYCLGDVLRPDNWDNDISSISALRCDGLVEVCYETNGLDLWGKIVDYSSHYNIQVDSYQAEHNEQTFLPLLWKRRLTPATQCLSISYGYQGVYWNSMFVGESLCDPVGHKGY